ncbi:hypothetical protein F5Y14DRAFT_450646 [Nemania sp. NC0429]|nr:hypothetical protein F5Y14DRAFT_450646 [Nemania sp. NC0429]
MDNLPSNIDPLEGLQDDEFKLEDLFPGVNFSEQVDDINFESMLAKGFPVKKQPEPPSPKLEGNTPQPTNEGYAQQLDDLIPTTLDFGNEIFSQQPGFIDPMQLYGAPQLTFNPQSLSRAPTPDQNWALPQQHALNSLPAFDNLLAQDLGFGVHPPHTQVYPQYFPMNNQMNGRPMNNQMNGHPMNNQMNGPPMMQQHAFTQPQPTNMLMNGQQVGYQQPVNPGYQMPWPAQYQPHQLTQPTISHPMPQPFPPTTSQVVAPQQRISHPIPQPLPQTISQVAQSPLTTQPAQQLPNQPMQATGSMYVKPESPKAPTTVDNRRDSELPDPKDSSRHSKRPPSAGTVTTSPPLKRPAKNHHGEVLLNEKIPRKTHTKRGPDTIEPERYYGPSPPRPKDWGPVDERGRHLFTYTEKGELAAGLFLEPIQMRQYLLGPSRYDKFDPPARLPGVKQTRRKYRQGLTLWIGWPASMSNSRYPRGGESTKCRFKNCRYRQTIQVGEPWVILDERQNVDGELIDPFHNAGYVHLFCLESHFDIVDLWHCIDIRPDYRSFKRESHPYFGLGYKLPGIDEQLQAWWVDAFKTWEHVRRMNGRRERNHNNSLTQCLVKYKLDHEPKGQTKNRQKRGGIDMAKHYGDPDVKKRLKKLRRYKLLDERGFPVEGADMLLEEIEARQRQQSEEAALDSPQSGLYAVQQPYPYGEQGGLEHAYATVPAGIGANPDHPIVLPPSPPETLAMPSEARGHKRSRGEFTADNSNQAAGEPSAVVESNMPSPKRQRVDDNAEPPAPQPVTQPTPTLKPTNTPGPGPTGTPDVEPQGTFTAGDAGHGESRKRSRTDEDSEEPDPKRAKTGDHPSSSSLDNQPAEIPDTSDPFEAMLGGTADPIIWDTQELGQELDDSALAAFFDSSQGASGEKLNGETDEQAESRPVEEKTPPVPPADEQENTSPTGDGDGNVSSATSLFGDGDVFGATSLFDEPETEIQPPEAPASPSASPRAR